MRQLIRAVSGLAVTIALHASGAPAFAEGCSAHKNLKEAAAATGVLSKMANATHLAGLDDPTVKVGPLTLLAPSDAAFDALPARFRDKLLAPENRQHLTDLLLYHAIPGEFPTERLLKAKARNYTIGAIGGEDLEINKRLSEGIGSLDIAGAKITQADIKATDGIIHIIDKVLIPESVMIALSQDAVPVEIVAEGDQ